MHRGPTERSFGFSVGAVCLAIGGWLWWRGSGSRALGLLGIGGLLVACAVVAPRVLRGPNRVWMRVAGVLGWLNARILLTVFFAVVLTPVGLLMRLFGRNPLKGEHGDSNWRPYSIRRRDPRHYENQF